MVHDYEEKVELHHREVHIAVALIAIAAATVVGSVPLMMFAQDTSSPPPQEQPQQPPPPPQPTFDPSQCFAKCETMKRECAANVKPEDQTGATNCNNAVNQCFQGCSQQGTPGSTGNFQPPQGGQFNPQQGGQFGPPPGAQQGQSGPGQFGPGGQQGQFDPRQQGQSGGQNPTGPSPEEMTKMKAMQAGLMARVKKQMTGFAQRMLKVKTRIAQLAKKGIKAPTELTDAIATAEEAIKNIQAAETPEALADATEGLQDVVDTIQEQMPNLERLSNLTSIYRRVDNEVKQLDRFLKADKNLAKKSKVDLTDAIVAFEKGLMNLKLNYADAKAKIVAGEVEEGFFILEENVFQALADVRMNHEAIVQIRQMQTTIKQVEREIASRQTQLNRLKKIGDVSDAQEILNEAKSKLAEIKTAAVAKPFDPHVVFDLLEELGDLRLSFVDATNELQGIAETKDIDTGLRPMDLDTPDLGLGASTTPDPMQ